MDRSVIFAVLLAATVMLWLAAPADAAITSVQIVDVNGNVLNLNHDSQTQSYADGSIANPNAFVKICSDNAAADLLNKFTGLYYKVGSSTIDLHVLPAKMTSVDGSGCATVDVDINFLKGRYGGIPQIAISDSLDLSSPTFWPLSVSTGYMRGNFTLKYVQAASNKLNVTVTHAFDESGNDITTNKKFILVGLLDSIGNVLDVKQVGINESVLMDWNGDANFNFVVNGLPFGQAFCGQGQTLCDDGICRPAGTCTLRGCSNDTANGACEIGEGCGCSDCYNQQDSCQPGLVCISGACGTRPAVPTGAVFGAVSEWNCTWTSTYDETAQPGNPIDLIYYHDCTLLREVTIDVSSIVIGARIKTLGNYTVISSPPSTAPTGYVFGYFAFEHNIPAEKFGKVLIQFKVPKKDLAAKGFQTSEITLRKFTAGSWDALPAKPVSEDNDYYFFESTPDTLSLFAIVAEHVGAAPTPAPAPIPTPAPPAVVTPAFPIVPIALTVLLMLVVIGLGYRWHARRPAAITMPVTKVPPTTPPEAIQLQQRIAEIKKALELPASRLAAPQVQKVAKIRKEAGKKIVKPKSRPIKRIKPAKKIGEKKFYRALRGVEKELR